MKYLIQLIAAIALSLIYTFAFAKAENTFYILHSKQIPELDSYLTTVEKHHKSIHILIAQAYQIDHNGDLTGYLNQALIDLTKKHSIKLMAMITNKGFNPDKAHTFLSSSDAQTKAINSIVEACKKYNLYGVQFDFEQISLDDKNALTQFYKKAADELHKYGFKVSFAVIPAFPNELENSSFLKKTYKNWSGVYDLEALGKFADFVTIMAYNQHPDGTIPGPNASITYVKASIQQALKFIPAEKISLGIPAYSLYWYSGHASIRTRQAEISYEDAMKLIKKHHSPLVWSHQDKVHYARYERHWLNEYVYLEDKHSFKAKHDLVKEYKLRGISVFRIGTEDKNIWATL